ncbi:hypothetical protein AX769_04015 [Frondihabitans sp. PAMC 28766]|uniref:YobI family P-loop NTPase n=1 Tax=Frondihabitans sp. PAMC 28766 TaxID=1795630 RepID=UPI00078E5DA0|nr:hypothetical protein [Frondihabitans sp. PAMC 28766]AMM19461.1 hypothetical protein AX769_04015 [Frondihabitans sp. PAMC 28766]
MSDKQSPAGAEKAKRAGQALLLSTLAPDFDEKRHRFYVDLLTQALDRPETKNVALTGAYGTGKSSILEAIKNDPSGHVVELSLSTIAPEASETDQSDDKATSRTNRLQKEIVKQLLYRLHPGKVPRSKFGRASVPRSTTRWLVATGAGAGVMVVLLGLGLVQPFVHARLTQTWRQDAAYLVLFGLAAVLARIVIALAYGRSTFSASVNAGPAMVNLSPKSQTYFDEYLDEIVYFFESSGATTVIVEDIDRFDDIHVFDTLRALNNLLNAADQIKKRIIFIYAIRDSVFDLIGIQDDETDPAKSGLKRANRTKFFDVIIPVVPFLSADNARDLMAETMTSTEFAIDRALIRLAARHVADMRLLHNIRNEFEIYRNQLVVPKKHVPGITDDLVFAVVLYKNTHLTGFEEIRYRASALDRLYSDWRALVAENLGIVSARVALLHTALDRTRTRAARANRLGTLLEQFRLRLEAAARVTTPAATVQLAGPLRAGSESDPALWEQIINGEAQQLVVSDQAGYRAAAITLSYSASQLGTELGVVLRQGDWDQGAVDATEADLRSAENDLAFLRHHSWQDLVTRPEFTLGKSSWTREERETPTAATFDELIQWHLDSELLRELVRHGYLTSHFALYGSHFYGEYLGVDALEYIRRCIEPGIPDATFPLDSDSIEQLLIDQQAEDDTAELFLDSGVYNVSIMNYLLTRRAAAATVVAKNLARRGSLETEFVDTYVAQGADPAGLLGAMAPFWPGVVQYAALAAPVKEELRPRVLDAILSAVPTDEVPTNAEVGTILAEHYHEISAITQPTSSRRAAIVLGILHLSGTSLELVEPLNMTARQVAITLRMFPIEERNLTALLALDSVIGLDTIAERRDLFSYVLDQLEDYLRVVELHPELFTIASDPAQFGSVLSAIAEAAPKLLEQAVALSALTCRIDDLASVNQKAWPALLIHNRTEPTFDNIAAHVKFYGVDASLGSFLSGQKKITAVDRIDQDARRDLAISILRAAATIPSTATRVRLAAGLKPGLIDPAVLPALAGDLVARMLKRGLIADEASTFRPDLMVDWPTLEVTLDASKKFATFVNPEILPAQNVAPLIRYSSAHPEVLDTVTADLGSYVATATPNQANSIAEALISAAVRLTASALSSLIGRSTRPALIIRLIALTNATLSKPDLKAVLGQMGGEYVRISTGGRGWPTFPPDDAHAVVLERLVGDTLKSFERVHFKGRGDRLKASLQ